MTGRRVRDPAHPPPPPQEAYNYVASPGRLAFSDRLHHLIPSSKARKHSRRDSSQRNLEGGGQQTTGEQLGEINELALPPPYAPSVGDAEQGRSDTVEGNGERSGTPNPAGGDGSPSPTSRTYLGNGSVR